MLSFRCANHVRRNGTVALWECVPERCIEGSSSERFHLDDPSRFSVQFATRMHRTHHAPKTRRADRPTKTCGDSNEVRDASVLRFGLYRCRCAGPPRMSPCKCPPNLFQFARTSAPKCRSLLRLHAIRIGIISGRQATSFACDSFLPSDSLSPRKSFPSANSFSLYPHCFVSAGRLRVRNTPARSPRLTVQSGRKPRD